ncbi:hypothetical protein, partial [Streptomyces tricolor]
MRGGVFSFGARATPETPRPAG